MRTIPLSEAKTRLSELAEEVDRTHERLLLTKNGRDYVVVLSIEDLESLEATLELLADPEDQETLRQSQREMERGEHLTEDEVRAMVARRSSEPIL